MSRLIIPPIAELRQRVRKSEGTYGRIPWVSRRVIHPYVSVYFTTIFLRLQLTGNQVTVLMMLCAAGGASLFFWGGRIGYLSGAGMMLLSWVLDHSDGEVLRFRGESSSLGIYLDRLTHRVSYPLMHLGMGVSLFRTMDEPLYLLFGGLVAYFYQLEVIQSIDKVLIAAEGRAVDRFPLRRLREHISARLRIPDLPLKLLTSGFSYLMESQPFVVLLALATILDRVTHFYIAYGIGVIFNWALVTVLDLTMAFTDRPFADTTNASGDIEKGFLH